ncbi:MAG TPA: branched-chain amino acid ABC transporter substrate-binding protein [Candidatus Lustribacter sp.]|nr:branched-chain amino acid ABC transporter substrate-binding protein [Candidatus Lustribacter sp.]
MRLTLVSRACFAAALVALAACSSSTTSSSSSSSTTAASAPAAAGAGGTIKIGVDLPVSGADAAIGVPTQNGVVLAIEQANKNGFAGGAFKLEASLLDDAVQGVHDPAAGAQNVKTFIADSAVLAIVGPFNSNVAKSEIPLTNDAGLAQISPSNTNDGLTIGPDAKNLRTAHPDTNAYFRVCTIDSKQGGALAQFAQKLGFKKIFIVDDNETYGKGLADHFESAYKALGGTVLGHEHVTKNQQDFKALLTKVQSTAPDAVFFGGNTSTGGGLLRRQMGDAGMSATPFMGGDGISDTAEFVKEAGPMAQNVYYSFAAPDADKLPSAKAFVAAYKARFNSDVGPYSAPAFAATQIIVAAIEKAVKDDGGKMPTRADVLKNIAATSDLPTVIGKVGFDANGDTTAPILTLKRMVAGGKTETVTQLTLK